MKLEDVLEFYWLLGRSGVKIWLDGGWGVDALLGKQTRSHKDLDIAVDNKDVVKLRELLAAEGFEEIQKTDTSTWNFVLSDSEGREIDVHSFEFDKTGKNIYGVAYPEESLTGVGKLDARKVHCISPKWVVKFRSAYKPKMKDLQDVQAICQKFELPLPKNYT